MTAQPVTRDLLEERYSATTGRIQLTGIQALARLPIDQHRRDLAAGRKVATFISGYEGSPLAGYDLELMRQKPLLDANDVHVVPGLNEEAAATAVQGSQLVNTFDGANRDGVLGIWYGKAPGLDRATDAFRHGNLMGAHPAGGCLLLVGDDPAAKSSSVPCASDFALADLAVPYLYPADSAEVLEMGLHAIELSRVSGLYTALKIVTAVADGSSTVDLAAEHAAPVRPRGDGRHEPSAKLLQPYLAPLERDQLTTRIRLAREYARLNGLNKVIGAGTADRVGIVAAGRTYREVLAALARLGISEAGLADSPVRLLKIGMPWPLEADTVREFAEGLDEVVVVEEKRSFLEAAIRDLLYGGPVQPRVVGKDDVDGRELLPAYGELDSDTIAPRLKRRLDAHGLLTPAVDVRADQPAGRMLLPLAPLGADAARSPYFCSGCPHNSSVTTTTDSLVGAGIGCSALVTLMDPQQVGEVTGFAQMGGEGLHWIGMAPFTDKTHYVQNLGDGTFDHSGSLAIRAAVGAGVDMTYRLLYNDAVAMTGGQRTVGGMDVPQIVDVLRAEKVARIIVTTEDTARYRKVRLPQDVVVWDRSRIEEAHRVLAGTPGVTVLIHDQECATEKRRKRKRGKLATPETRVVINEAVCEGCGDCGRKSNCLSVQPVDTDHGRKTKIHQASCNVDYSCLDGDCPAFMSVTVPAGGGRRKKAITSSLASDAIAEPALRAALVGRDEVGVRMTGVGGTGIVTVSQVLAMAGLLAGWNVRSLDQTGLAQKGGAVVSDVRFSRSDGTSNKIEEGEADLYLGCDLLVAADPTYLKVAAPDRTVAVLSTAKAPTGRMVSDVTVEFPDVDEVAAHVADRAEETHVLDARELTIGLFGDDQYANIFLVGVGYQSGALPVPAQAIEDAIALNGVAVEHNLQAFRRGRQHVVDPAAVRAVVAEHAPSAAADPAAAEPGESELDRLVRTRTAELTAYQDEKYAARYARAVARVVRREEAVAPGSTVLSESVARHLAKVMAYKDEYEVARLCLDPAMDKAIEEEFGVGARAQWRLHPPALRAMGMERKLALGAWFRPMFVLLHALRGLRGTALDPFGRAHVRVVERELVDEYLALVDLVETSLTADNLAVAVELAGLPDGVRGYEDVKLRNVETYRARRAELLPALQG